MQLSFTFDIMNTFQEQYDDAMLSFSMGQFDEAIEVFKQILSEEPGHFDAQLALGMAYYRKGDFETAIAEGLKAEKLRPDEQLVHTNLSLFYMRNGDKLTAESHGLKARIASWKKDDSPPTGGGDSDLKMAGNEPQNIKLPEKFPDMPWKKKS